MADGASRGGKVKKQAKPVPAKGKPGGKAKALGSTMGVPGQPLSFPAKPEEPPSPEPAPVALAVPVAEPSPPSPMTQAPVPAPVVARPVAEAKVVTDSPKRRSASGRGERVTFYLPPELAQWLRVYSAGKGWSDSFTATRAIQALKDSET